MIAHDLRLIVSYQKRCYVEAQRLDSCAIVNRIVWFVRDLQRRMEQGVVW